MMNPLQMLLQAAQAGANPMQMLAQQAGNNPQLQQLQKICAGKTPQQLREIAENMCRERGTTPQMIMRSLGLK